MMISKNYVIAAITCALFLSGCAGGDRFSTAESNGSGGEDSESGGSGGDDMKSTGGNGTGSIPGDGDGDGTGGETNPGGSGGNSTGGMGGSNTGGNGNTCVPETCAQIGERMSGVTGVVACGDVTDICGNEVYCPEECGSGLFCGASYWNDEAEGTPKFAELEPHVGGLVYDKFTYPVNQNTCGHECINLKPKNGASAFPCDSGFAVYCSEGVEPTEVGACSAETYSDGTYWCCEGDGVWDYQKTYYAE